MKFKINQSMYKNTGATMNGYILDIQKEAYKSLKGIDNHPINSWEPMLPPKTELLEKVNIHDIVTDIMGSGRGHVLRVAPKVVERPHIKTTTAPKVSETITSLRSGR